MADTCLRGSLSEHVVDGLCGETANRDLPFSTYWTEQRPLSCAAQAEPGVEGAARSSVVEEDDPLFISLASDQQAVIAPRVIREIGASGLSSAKACAGQQSQQTGVARA